MAVLCLRCGKEAGFNRAIVERASGVCIGGLCIRCEERAFGSVLQRTERTGANCSLCSRDGEYALPEWTPYTEPAADGSLVARVEYDIDADSVHLCDRHLSLVDSERIRAEAVAVNTSAIRSRR